MGEKEWAVVIHGHHDSYRHLYETEAEAISGADRARRKIAFARMNIEVVKLGGGGKMNPYIAARNGSKFWYQKSDAEILEQIPDDGWGVDAVIDRHEVKRVKSMIKSGHIKLAEKFGRPVYMVAKFKCSIDGTHWVESESKKCRYCLPVVP
jgi:hypothetical protein